MAIRLSLKDHISSPLEAGTPLVDGSYLPGRLNEALEYASKRLARKSVSPVTLIAVRRDNQLPTSPLASPASPPVSALASVSSTPARPNFAVSRLSSIRHLVRSTSSASHASDGQIKERIVHIHHDHHLFRNGTISPAFSEASMASASTASTNFTSDSIFSHRLRWPTSPRPLSSVPMTPATPFTALSSPATATSFTGSMASGALLRHPNRFGFRLAHVGPLTARDEKILAQTIDKAARKFKIGADWLPPVVSPAALGLSTDLVLRSIVQNERLYASEPLVLLSLDHLYTFRTALQSYARTQASSRLEDAVDELRRLILANGRQRLRKSDLLAAYRWMEPVSDAALSDVCRMYSRAYGGLEQESGLENDVDAVAPATRASIRTSGQLPPHPEPASRDEVHDDTPVPSPDTPQMACVATPLFETWAPEEKEISVKCLDVTAEDLELDAIEAWYRNVQINVNTTDTDSATDIDISSSHSVSRSSSLARSVVVEIAPPMSIENAQLEALRRATPKLAAAPPGRNISLKLQTKFDKPVPKRHAAPLSPLRREMKALMGRPEQKPQQQQQQQQQQQHIILAPGTSSSPSIAVIPAAANDYNGGDRTARPSSAATTASHWSFSIDGILSGSTPISTPLSSRFYDASPTSAATTAHLRVGPITPNCYDDISPITRGEWGMLMGGEWNNGKRAPVETCLQRG
ncbi:hypothetical protein B0T24DRAFT_182474 [Lasiosphaeria ovina]|uniref:DUF7582 domain-containing protein n=1 Tax=Lasiosphaeria ovina TaxID=92902 RepID=A0AAE0NEL6_9PEZI|nr:hypothetical protein B0T24DRAFT_182474 [Lasiosphaeria ovina]